MREHDSGDGLYQIGESRSSGCCCKCFRFCDAAECEGLNYDGDLVCNVGARFRFALIA